MRRGLEADRERLGAAQRGPAVVGHDCGTARNRDHVAHAADVANARLVEALEFGAVDRCESRAGVEHAGPLDVGGEHRFATHLGRQVQARRAAGCTLAHRGIAQHGLRGRRQLRRRAGEFADPEAALRRSVHDFATGQLELAVRHAELRSARREQHVARLRRCLAQRGVPVPHTPGTARAHRAVAAERVGRFGRDHVDAPERHAEFVGHQHGVRGVRALPHLGRR